MHGLSSGWSSGAADMVEGWRIKWSFMEWKRQFLVYVLQRVVGWDLNRVCFRGWSAYHFALISSYAKCRRDICEALHDIAVSHSRNKCCSAFCVLYLP